MTDSKLYEKLKQKLEALGGVKIKWWIGKYLPWMKHSTAISQLNGFNPMSDNVRDAIKKYLAE